MATTVSSDAHRSALARQGHTLELLTVAWAMAEGALALITAKRAHSLSLAGFGFDSLIEVVSGIALMWRMSHEMALTVGIARNT